MKRFHKSVCVRARLSAVPFARERKSGFRDCVATGNWISWWDKTVDRAKISRAAAESRLAQGVSPGSSGKRARAAERRHHSRHSLFSPRRRTCQRLKSGRFCHSRHDLRACVRTNFSFGQWSKKLEAGKVLESPGDDTVLTQTLKSCPDTKQENLRDGSSGK